MLLLSRLMLLLSPSSRAGDGVESTVHEAGLSEASSGVPAAAAEAPVCLAVSHPSIFVRSVFLSIGLQMVSSTPVSRHFFTSCGVGFAGRMPRISIGVPPLPVSFSSFRSPTAASHPLSLRMLPSITTTSKCDFWTMGTALRESSVVSTSYPSLTSILLMTMRCPLSSLTTSTLGLECSPPFVLPTGEDMLLAEEFEITESMLFIESVGLARGGGAGVGSAGSCCCASTTASINSLIAAR
mmetsp:Transcript_7294/g.17819  ORF Transcript_7294/g.17819 Transcript_7294/m.17819 type:complete len:240 (+) Transcript_7294:628-1347(+)